MANGSHSSEPVECRALLGMREVTFFPVGVALSGRNDQPSSIVFFGIPLALLCPLVDLLPPNWTSEKVRNLRIGSN